jgi:hypothetical protein
VGSAEAIPFDDASVDVTLAITVLEEATPTGCWRNLCG